MLELSLTKHIARGTRLIFFCLVHCTRPEYFLLPSRIAIYFLLDDPKSTAKREQNNWMAEKNIVRYSTRPDFFLRSSCIRVNLLRKLTDRREQNDWRTEKKWTGDQV